MTSRTRLHSWDLKPKDAVALQRELASRVILKKVRRSFDTIAATDISFNRYSDTVYGAIIVMDAYTMQVLETVKISDKARYPYIPGLLSFREAPTLLRGFKKLKQRPDVVICDGQGLAHPRRLGLACHLGLWLDRPTLGCAKSVLVGKHHALGAKRGAKARLVDQGEQVGYALRTRERVQPVYVSPGHLCDFDQAADLVLKVTPRYRLPEPIRQAHLAANEARVKSSS